jgi:glycosyltransferase involved in cell wall biosynthesis
MKVLYLTNLPAPYRIAFFQELGKLCDLTVTVETETATDRNKEWFCENSHRNFRYVVLPGIRWGNDSAFNPSVLRWLKDRSYDIVVVGGHSSPTEILAILYMKLKNIPFVASADGGFTARNEPALKRRLKKLLIQSARYWMVSGETTRKYLEFYGADPKRTYHYPFTSLEEKDVLPKPVEVAEKESYKQLLGIGGSLVLSVGRFIPLKGFDILLKAWSLVKHDNANLVMIGGGPEQPKYAEMIRDLELKNVKVLDFMKKDELMLWYRAADVFVLPTRCDTWGLVINEAMAQGLPVITTSGALAGLELIRDGENGYVVPVEDADTLAEHIELLLSNNELRQSMAKCSNEIIRSHTITNMACAYIQAFEDILKSRRYLINEGID